MTNHKRKEIPSNQRIFVNRSINMAKITAIGLDMDHTLAPYNREAFENLAFNATLCKFIEAGYPDELIKLSYKNDFLIRGLLVDRERGNILKVDGHKYVKTAYHGHRELSKSERHKIYNRPGYKADQFLSMDTFFALSEVQLFSEIVDFMDKNPGRIDKSFKDVYSDLRKFIDTSHKDGSIKNKVIANPQDFIIRDKHLPQVLQRLLDAGKSLFLLTNSHWEYTHEIMKYAFDNLENSEVGDWKEYFDVIIVGGGKPGFFTGTQPFFEVIQSSGLLKITDGSFKPSGVYHGGNARLFEKLAQQRGDEILYVGDHIHGDIIQSKGTLNWRTMLIVEELEEELPKLEKLKEQLIVIQEKISSRENSEEELQRLRSKIASIILQKSKALEKNDQKKAHYLAVENDKHLLAAKELTTIINDADLEIKALIKDRERQIHPVWGSLMKVGLNRSRIADQISSYACIYTGRLSNLRYYSPYKKFSSFHELMAHD